jgi:hypothetical protein
MPEARTPRPDDRPPAGLSAGLLIVAAVIVVHLVFALLIGLGTDDPALADPGRAGRSVACQPGPSGEGAATGPSGACVTPAGPTSEVPAEPPAPEPAIGGRGSY